MKARTAVFASSLCSVALLMPGAASAAPVQWEVNGHWYEVVPIPNSWGDARVAASNRLWMGLNGHLATITSREENLFISGLSTSIAGYHLGGLQDPAATTPSAGWQWITGEAFNYNNWDLPLEPNDVDGVEGGEFGGTGEDWLQLFGRSDGDGITWNDFSGGFEGGYIVEYGALAAIPEPQTYALLLAGLGLLGFAARRRAR